MGSLRGVGWVALGSSLALGWLSACGGSQDLDFGDEGAGAAAGSGASAGRAGSAGSAGRAGSGGSAGSAGSGGRAGDDGGAGTAGQGGSAGSGGRDAGSPWDAGGADGYVDPPCPDAPPPPPDWECDPLAASTGCGAGEACYPYVVYPSSRCDQERYGSVCRRAGRGGQGVDCYGGDDCAAGFVCVVTGQRTQCVQMCPLRGETGCPRGLVCEPVDVEGIGGCF